MKLKKYCIFVLLLINVLVSTNINSQEIYLPFVEDFSSYTGQPREDMWINKGAIVNNSYQYNPPSVGVVTLDILDAQGKLYPQANIYSFAADTLQSRPIRLDTIITPVAKQLKPSDSVYLSFFIQPCGAIGDMWERLGIAPASKDSMILQFYKANQDLWQTVYKLKGLNLDTIYNRDSLYFIFVNILIDDTAYFNSEFAFRFINYGSLDSNPSYDYVTNCGQWNIDYIYLNCFRSCEDTIFRDVAFVDRAPKMLKQYNVVPAKHFDPSLQKDTLDIKIANLYSSTLNSYYKYNIMDSMRNIVYSYNGGYENIDPYFTTHSFQNAVKHSKPELGYTFTPHDKDYYIIEHIVSEGVGQDNRHENDTIRYIQKFDNYFAYDDGTAESGIGIEPISCSMLAQGYDLLQNDTLYKVDIYFNNTYRDANLKPFSINIYSSTDDSLLYPDRLIYSTDRLTPDFTSLNEYCSYILPEPIVLNSGRFFIALKAFSSTYLNIGFDQNNDASDNIFDKRTTSWNKVFLKGALMIRPYFGYQSVSIEDINNKQDLVFYPNPANEYLYVDNNKHENIYIFDLYGREVLRSKQNIISLQDLPSGIYIIKLNTITKKLIISH